MNATILKTIEQAKALSVPSERQSILLPLVEYIRTCQQENRLASLTFICTHNSRRSHLGQVWAAVMAEYFGLEQIATFSGGTETTACHPNTLAALQSQGVVVTTANGENPLHTLSWGTPQQALCWSKVYNDAKNPQEHFAAIMTCGSADKGCPFIPGAEIRIPCTYVDPKASDGTPEQDATYQERSLQIASEMAWAMSQAKA